MAVATLTPAGALRRPRRADPRALIGMFLTLAALGGSAAFWVGASDAHPVLVATRELAAGTLLRSSDLSIAYVRMDDALLQAALPSDMLDSLNGRELAEPIHAQQVLVRAQVADRLGLVADQVAITIPAQPDSAVAGRLREGDTVQILVTTVDKGRNEAHTHPVLDHAQVFAVGRDQAYASSSVAADASSSKGSISSVTLAVSADQARQLAEARRTGELDVLLLPPPEIPHP